MHERDVLLHFARGHRPAERATREVRHDARDAPALVLAVPMATRVNPIDALPRRAGHLRIRAADIDGAYPHAVQRGLLELCLLVLERLA